MKILVERLFSSSQYTKYIQCLSLLIMMVIVQQASARTYYVDSAHADASDKWAGDVDRPFKTLEAAAKVFRPGDHLIIAGGVYRGAIKLVSANWSSLNASTIEGRAGEEVIIKGSEVVKQWKPLGDGVYVSTDWPHNSQQVFLDGVPLSQIGGVIYGGYPVKKDHPLFSIHKKKGIWPGRKDGGVGKLAANSFYYDLKNKKLYIKLAKNISPTGRLVEVSTRPYLVSGKDVNGLVVRNIGMLHSNTSGVSRGGAITLSGSNISLENLTVTYADGVGIVVRGDNNLIKNAAVKYSGQLGMNVKGYKNRLYDNETSYNNTRGFNKWWEAGGAKFIGDGGLRDSEIARHKSYFNTGDGLWLDWGNHNNLITGCQIAYNTGFGIHYEASQRSEISNNTIFGNGQRGIYIFESTDIKVFKNLVVSNGLEGIVVGDSGRKDPAGKLDLRPKKKSVVDNILAWNGGQAALILAKDESNMSDRNIYISADQLIFFSIGWPNKIRNPAMAGLTEWTNKTGNDTSARHLVSQMPVSIERSLAERKVDIDWAPVYTAASEVTVAP